MTAALLLAALAAADPVIDVHVLGRHHPPSLVLRGPRIVALAVRGDELLVDGVPRRSLELPRARWTVELPDGEVRTYEGSPRARAGVGEIRLHVAMALEDHVAAVVASETEPGTPDAALRAQAIAVRSYALAARRHGDGSACDLAHCQVLAGAGPAAHLARAARAASATAGLVLKAGGAVIAAPYHAECAGHTADAAQVFGGEDAGGPAAVPDPGCGGSWSAELERGLVDRVLARVLGQDEASLEDVEGERGSGGYLVRVRDRRTGRFAAGDALVRALDAAAGRGVVRSGFMEWRGAGSTVHLRGRGLGHGVGLCQAGAARLARQGRGERDILAHYFRGARVAPR